MPRPLHGPVKQTPPGWGPVSGSNDSPGDSTGQAGLSTLYRGSVSEPAAWLSSVDEGRTGSSGTDCHVHLKYVNGGNQG